MKKLVSILLLFSVLFNNSYNAQFGANEDPIVEEKEPQKLRFGIKGYSSIGWLSPENELSLTRGKLGLGFGWGLNSEFYINKTTSFRTGFSLSTYSAGLNYNDNDKTSSAGYFETYYVDKDAEFQIWENDSIIPAGDLYRLNSRKYKLSYLNIPLLLKLKTKEIGFMTYYGEFGGMLGFKTKSSVKDTRVGVYRDSLNSIRIPEHDPTYELNFDDVSQPIRAGLCLGAGAEYNFSGSTALFFQINWNYFMTNMMKKEEKDNYLRSFDNDENKFESVNSKSIPGSFHLTVGILF